MEHKFIGGLGTQQLELFLQFEELLLLFELQPQPELTINSSTLELSSPFSFPALTICR